MKIGILGTRGIPNFHGGFEQFAEYFAVFLAKQNHEVVVYNSSLHPYKKNTFENVKILHCKDYEDKIGTAGQFFYDLNCIRDARKQNFDILLQLGYTSSSIWGWLLPKKAHIITNMDGLEWKRSKYNKITRDFLLFAEKLAVNTSDTLVADSLGIQSYLKNKYKAEAIYIAYGAELFENPNAASLEKYNLEVEKYNMLIARIEPENNIEIILDGFIKSKSKDKFLVIGDADANAFGRYLKEKFAKVNNIIFIGSIYNLEELNNLRYFSKIYFHGHSVGGTNPSLLEAMSSGALICAHDNEFNKAILENDAFYFSDADAVANQINAITKLDYQSYIKSNLSKIEKIYQWRIINNSYLQLMKTVLKSS